MVLGKALRNQCDYVEYMDHHQTVESGRIAMDTARAVAKHLGLKYLEFIPVKYGFRVRSMALAPATYEVVE